ncbi:MAG: hypothetical protein M1840_004784 [Geoglossum simile]|nr:MAG: hypothetical protein M1840_004784 [Geoglossum simile]
MRHFTPNSTTPLSPTTKPPKPHFNYIDQSDHTNSLLNLLKSSDHLEVRAALAELNPEILLDQIDKPIRSNWQNVIEDWFPIKVPQPIFDEWNTHRGEWDHLRLGYDPVAETMIIKCMPLKIHKALPACFLNQAALAMDWLSRTAKKELS